jgi:hypothetical protein
MIKHYLQKIEVYIMRLVFIQFLIFISFSAFAQFTYTFESNNYTGDTLIIGYYQGEKTLVKDTLFRDKSGKYIWQEKTNVNPGIYIALIKPSNNIFQFIVNKEDKFEIRFDTTQLAKIEVKGSAETKLFMETLLIRLFRPSQDGERQPKPAPSVGHSQDRCGRVLRIFFTASEKGIWSIQRITKQLMI